MADKKKVPVKELVSLEKLQGLKGITHKGRPARLTGTVSVQLELDDGKRVYARAVEVPGTSRVAARVEAPAKKAPARKKASPRKATAKKTDS
jgi:hypothetical protein